MQLQKVVFIKYLLKILTLKEQKPFWEELEFISLCLWDVYVLLELLGILFESVVSAIQKVHIIWDTASSQPNKLGFQVVSWLCQLSGKFVTGGPIL